MSKVRLQDPRVKSDHFQPLSSELGTSDSQGQILSQGQTDAGLDLNHVQHESLEHLASCSLLARYEKTCKNRNLPWNGRESRSRTSESK